ncbi:MAG TPA: fumarylacetoacetate hydrolase family protein [Chloroflexota bacterium]|nr:fumarylacetoacetate hydrolase family protein [Chloroflexota bacterium]
MRLLTFTAQGERRAGLEVDGKIVDLAGAAASRATGHQSDRSLPSDLLLLLEAGEAGLRGAHDVEAWVAAELKAGRTPLGPGNRPIIYDPARVGIGPPIARPGKIICLGRNYAEHAAESGHEVLPAPILFAKFANTIGGPGDAIIASRATKRLDYEAELAVVIGKRAKHVALEDALEFVAGYMNLNDVSARDLQNETSQWLRGKGGDTWAPCGPYLVTRDEIPDPHALRIRCLLNGEVMQDSNTSKMIFKIPYLIHHISQTITLEPGDVISTGTPSGVGDHRNPPRYLHGGDVVQVEVEGLGTLENPVVEE